MSKKIVVAFVVAAMAFGGSFGSVQAQQVAPGISFSQLVELLIASGLIPQEKAGAARAMLTLQSQSATVSTTAETAPSSNETTASTAARHAALAPVAAPVLSYHSADTNKDWKISESELSRVTDLYNSRMGTVRVGAYHSAPSTVDGFEAGAGTIHAHHSADTDRDGKISLLEYTRVIELKNSPNGYLVHAGTEDGYAPAPASVAQSVDLKINGADSATIANRTYARATWTSSGVKSCNASGSSFDLAGGGRWGFSGLLDASGAATLIISTSGATPATFTLGIQCTTTTGTTVTDSVTIVVTAMATTPVIPATSVVPVTPVVPATPAVVTPTAPVTPVVAPSVDTSAVAPSQAVNLTNGISYKSVPASVTVGSTIYVGVQNTGTKPWGPSHDMALSSNDLTANYQLQNLGTTGAGATKSVSFTAPTTPGIYKIRAVEQGVAWFGDVKSITVTAIQAQQPVAQPQPITGTLSVSSTCVVPGTNVTATAVVTGDGVTSKTLEKDTNADGVYGTAATWGSGTGTHTFTTAEGGAYSGRIDLKLVVNGTVKDSKSVTVSTACGPQTQNYSQACGGTAPTGSGVVKGYESYTVGYGTNQWTFVTGTPSACQWSCASGYGVSGNSCQQNPATPVSITYQACSGTEPSGSYISKGNGYYQTGYGTTNWTFVTGTPAACQFACANGAVWNGAACAVPAPTVSLMANTSCAAPGSTITVTSYVSGTPIESNYIERDTPAENSQYGDGIFGGKADYGASGGSHSYTQTTEREGYYDFRAVVNNSITSSVRVYSGASCGDTSMVGGSSNLGSAIVGFDSLVKLLELLR